MLRCAGWVAVVVLLTACSAAVAPTPARQDSGAHPDDEALTYPERIELVVACLSSNGFEASSYEGFGIRIDAASDEQLAVAQRIEGECWEEVNARFPAPPPLSVEDQYDYMIEVANCLRELGYTIPEAPTRETYVDSRSADRPPSEFWDPYAILARQGVDTWALQRESCPPYPWAR